MKTDNRLEKIDFTDILLAEAMENVVVIHNRDRKIITYLTLKMLQEKLAGRLFIHPHQSFGVAIEKIGSIEGNILHVGK